MKNYKILASQKEDINSPSIWILDKDIDSRVLCKISVDKGNSVWVDVQTIDDNFINNYNGNPNTLNIKEKEPTIVINEWYRKKLNIKTKTYYDIKICPNKCGFLYPIRQMQAALQHPDNSVRICADLTMISVVLGLIGLALGIISLIK